MGVTLEINYEKGGHMKKTLLVLFGMGFLLLALSSESLAQSYELSFSGTSFTGRSETENYFKNYGEIFKISSAGWLVCQVNFPASAGGMKVSRLSATFLDNTNLGELQVQLVKIDRWTGNSFIVGNVSSGLSQASASVSYMNQSRSLMSGVGIDNNRWAWAIWALFSETGGGGRDVLRLHSVTIRYE